MVYNKIKSSILTNLTRITELRATREQKLDNSYVTKGDLLVQQLVINAIAAEFNDFKIISEELKNLAVDLNARDVFVVDPIDGTENFTSGFVEWGVSISHYRNGAHFESLLFCPEMNLAVQTGDTIKRHQSRVRGLSSSLVMEDLINATQGYEYRILGCCVYNMMCVLRGSFCSFENPKGANSWDILAGLNLALEHDLKVTVNDKEYHGEYLPHTQKYRFKVEG
ncbi:MAG: hypothetical protein SynsKO_20670 [Synoicihabitans sp.]